MNVLGCVEYILMSVFCCIGYVEVVMRVLLCIWCLLCMRDE